MTIWQLLKSHQNIAYATVAVVLFSAALFTLNAYIPNYFLTDDNVNQYLPYYAYNWRSMIEAQTIPLINLHQFLGHTYFSQAQSSVLYPPVYLAGAVSLLFSGDIYQIVFTLAFLHYLVGLISMYWLQLKHRVTPAVALLTSLLWITFPYLITVSRSWIILTYLIALLPLNFLILEHLLKKPRIATMLLLVLVKTALFYQGYIQHEVMVIQFELLYLGLVFTSKLINQQPLAHFKKFIKHYIVSYILFLGLIAPLLLPLLNTQQASSHRSAKLPIQEFLYGALPIDTLTKAQLLDFLPETTHGSSSHIFYIGPFILLLIATIVIRNRQDQSTKSNHAAIFAILAATALLFTTNFYSQFYSIPILNLFRWPFKYFLPFLFFLTLYLGTITSTAIKSLPPAKRLPLYSLLILSIVLNILVIWQNRLEAFGIWRTDIPPQPIINDYIDPLKGRVMTYQSDPKNHLPYNEASFDSATLFGYYHFGGYDGLVSELNDKLTLSSRQPGIHSTKLDQPTLDHLSRWSVRYIVTTNSSKHKDELLLFEQLKLLVEGQGIALYENTAALPYAYPHSQPDQPAAIDFGINEVVVSPTEQQAHPLIVNLAPLRNFQYSINNGPLEPIERTSGPITIDLPANTNQVTIKYRDSAFLFGLGIVVAELVLLTLIAVRHSQRNSRKTL